MVKRSQIPPLNTREEQKAWHDKLDKSRKLMEDLDIPHTPDPFGRWTRVEAHDLYDILMDEKALKALVSKLKNKAFW